MTKEEMDFQALERELASFQLDISQEDFSELEEAMKNLEFDLNAEWTEEIYVDEGEEL